jgi:hypothetical protein
MKVFALILLAVFVACAADVSGKWKSEFQTPNGDTRTTTYTFNVEGNKLTGTIAGGRGGEVQIQDGTVSGDEISFTVVRSFGGNEIKQNFKGKVSGDEIKFTVTTEGRGSREMTAKRIS